MGTQIRQSQESQSQDVTVCFKTQLQPGQSDAEKITGFHTGYLLVPYQLSYKPDTCDSFWRHFFSKIGRGNKIGRDLDLRYKSDSDTNSAQFEMRFPSMPNPNKGNLKYPLDI